MRHKGTKNFQWDWGRKIAQNKDKKGCRNMKQIFLSSIHYVKIAQGASCLKEVKQKKYDRI